ncbi:hypothetical protein LWI29_032033 [Acer saccharum]|uniref:Uncharacterized protein n=1 Tax=Acer saccharum TaxID=4024 RepID=A0AA39VVZ7_ACESA|nr:hypothetical protein LWI29_032033 [Acer saccharum]
MKPSLLFERSDQRLGVLLEDDSSIKAEYLGLEEKANLLTMTTVEPVKSSVTSPSQDWSNFESDDLFNQSSSRYQCQARSTSGRVSVLIAIAVKTTVGSGEPVSHRPSGERTTTRSSELLALTASAMKTTVGRAWERRTHNSEP